MVNWNSQPEQNGSGNSQISRRQRRFENQFIDFKPPLFYFPHPVHGSLFVISYRDCGHLLEIFTAANLCKNFLQMFYLFKMPPEDYDKTCKNERYQSAW